MEIDRTISIQMAQEVFSPKAFQVRTTIGQQTWCWISFVATLSGGRNEWLDIAMQRLKVRCY
jgi:hypothetical protein